MLRWNQQRASVDEQNKKEQLTGRVATRFSLSAVLRNTIYALLVFLTLLAAPTGWLYDFWAGTGTEQGQWPNESVEQVLRQEDVEEFFLSHTPATISGGKLAACPLARLRDLEEEGTHYYHSGGTKRSVYVSEYSVLDYPISPWQRIQRVISGGAYNRYYLAELEDGSWVCVYFDDYLVWTKANRYPTGYVRYTTTEERRALRQMAEDYEVDPVYILDLYRHGKVNWILDVLLRIALCAVVAALALGVKKVVCKFFHKI